MPAEVSLLLPNVKGASGLITAVEGISEANRSKVLGLFLADPFFNVGIEAARLRDAGFGWITNLPSVAQQDLEFEQLLEDVGLDHGLEIERLGKLGGAGFHILAVVSNAATARAAATIRPRAIIVLPRVVDFAAGFPSLRQRGAAAREVAEAARSAGWQGLLLGLAAESEIGHETLWPEVVDGMVCRPVPLVASLSSPLIP